MKATEMPPSFAVHWARELGAAPNTLVRLRGGINNQVFRCGDGTLKWVIKGYAPARAGHRDRMQAEKQFLQFASQVAPGFTPALIHADPDRRCIVLEYLDGQQFSEGTPPPAEAVATAVRFIYLLNREPLLAKEIIQTDAAEGFLSLRQHLANVRGRLKLMDCKHVKSAAKSIAEPLLEEIRNKLIQLEDRTNRLIQQGIVMDTIEAGQRCISPSDFGFHNAISTSTGIKFIDFEFAGWDDPAKTTLDFVLQPRVPVVGYGSPLLSAWDTEYQHSIRTRCQHLAPILKLKWLCILLSVLNPSRLKEILSVMPEEEITRLVLRRLESAKYYCASIRE